MKTLKFLPLLIAFTSFLSLQAQDIHFSQFAMSPLLLNPALAGFGQGDIRAYANFRTQWNTIAGGNAYRTFAGGTDLAIGKATRYSSFAGVGVSFFSDQSGMAGFQTNRVELTAAYHIVLSRNRNTTLSLGIQGGFNSRGFDPSKATYDFNYDPATGGINNNQRETFTRTKVYYGDVSAGAFFSTTLRSGTDIYIGAGVGHINQPRISYFSDATRSSVFNEKLDMKFTAHGGATVVLNPKLWIIPNFFLLIQGPASQYNAGAMIKLQLGNKVLSRNFLYLGAQLRVAHAMDVPMADAAIIHCRFDYKSFTLGLSYDVNISKLSVSTNTFGAPEISLVYTINTKHKSRQGYCPVMM
jgi:type IX secretion system PorP/SprF family membrane protein